MTVVVTRLVGIRVPTGITVNTEAMSTFLFSGPLFHLLLLHTPSLLLFSIAATVVLLLRLCPRGRT